MNYDPLVQELSKPEYASMSDQQAADAINAKLVMVREPIAVADVKAYSIQQGFFADIDEACNDSDASKRKLCKNVRAWIDDAAGKLHTIDIDSSAAIIMLEGLVAFALMTRTQANELKAMANKSRLWTELNGWSLVESGHVQSARRMISEVK